MSGKVPVPASRVRAPNFTREDQVLLMDVLKPYLHIIECKKTGIIKLCQKTEAWSNVCLNYNANTNNGPRSKKNLMSCYRNMKSQLKKQHSATKMNLRGKIDKASEKSHNDTSQALAEAKSELVKLQTELVSMKIKHNCLLQESKLNDIKHKIKIKELEADLEHKIKIKELEADLEHKRKMQERELEDAIKEDKFKEEIRRKKLMLLDLEKKIILSNL